MAEYRSEIVAAQRMDTPVELWVTEQSTWDMEPDQWEGLEVERAEREARETNRTGRL